VVRALDPVNGEERLIDPFADDTALGHEAARAARDDAARRVTVEGRDWFLSVYNTPWEIAIIGAGHIAQALAALAKAAGYRVRVIDPRTPYASAARFPGVALEQQWPDEALTQRPLSERCALIALAHDPRLDDAALRVALRSPACYIGALGSAGAHARRLARLGEAGFGPAELARIRGPVGLAIGARSPAEIAIAILAELVQCRRAHKAPRIAGILLAAGMSRRMGVNKLTARIKGQPLVRHAAEAALAGQLRGPLIVVTGHEAAAVHDALAGMTLRFVHNARYAEGLSTSLRAGIGAVPTDCDGALVLLGDMPAITPELVARVIAAFDPRARKAICVARATNGERGHPVLWGRQFFPEIETLTGDNGARTLMAAHAGWIIEVDAGDDAPLIDIDTPEALNALNDP
jgi:CTP:molybdopterin cytidylyltransferase MocA/xanthine/CO dehydrogenase XdhC/CoxF family maturation factor